MAEDSTNLEEMRRRLEALPSEIASQIGARSTDWPDRPGTEAPTLPESGGGSAAMFEPVVARLERIADRLETGGSGGGGWGGAPQKMYQANEPRAWMTQMPVAQSLGLASQAWGNPPEQETPPHYTGAGPLGHFPQQHPQTAPEPAPSIPSILPPVAPSSVGMPSAPATVSAPPGLNLPSASPPPSAPSGSVASSSGPDGSAATLPQVIEHLRLEIANLRQSLTNESVGAATDTPLPSTGTGTAQGPTQAQGSPQPAGAMPEVGPGSFPMMRDAHRGGAITAWDAGLSQARLRG